MKEILNLDGVGDKTAEKLEEAGIVSLMALAVSSPNEIAELTGLNEKAARKLIRQAREELQLGFEVAHEYAKRRSSVKQIGTGCSNFDEILRGGFESGHINEVYGIYGSGKTQLCHLICVRTVLENPNNKIIYIDTEATFRADRIKDFSEANGIDYDKVMNQIYISRAYNSDHQILMIDEIEKMLQKDPNYRTLIVDSLTSHFRSEYQGRGTLANRQQKLNKHMHQILRLADLYNLVAIVTNQVMSDPAQMFGDPIKPIGGNIVGHISAVRIYLRPAKQGSHMAKLIDSPNLPQAEASFYITKNGFENNKPK